MQKYILIFLLLIIFVLSGTSQDHNALNASLTDDHDRTIDLDKLQPKEHLVAVTQLNSYKDLKARNSYTHRLDSVLRYKVEDISIAEPVGKVSYVFDETNRREVIVGLTKPQNSNIFIVDSYSVFTYNKHGALVKQTYTSGDGTNNNWNEDNPSVIRQYTYNEKGLLILYQGQNIDDIVYDRPGGQVLYTYNESDQLTKLEVSYWRNEANDLVKQDEIFYTYNTDGSIKDIVRYAFRADRGWEPYDSTSFVYNLDGDLVKESYYGWTPSENFFPFYVGYHELSQKLLFYDSIGILNKVENYNSFDHIEKTWYTPEIDEYTYHDYGSLAQVITIDSMFFPFDWQPIQDVTYKHEANIPFDQVLFYKQRFNKNDVNAIHHQENHMILESEEHYYQYSFGSLDGRFLRLKKVYYYSELPTSTSDIDLKNENFELLITPNPTADFINIALGDNITPLTVSIYDSQGQLMIKTELDPKQRLDVSAWDQGVYYCTINDDGRTLTRNFVKM